MIPLLTSPSQPGGVFCGIRRLFVQKICFSFVFVASFLLSVSAQVPTHLIKQINYYQCMPNEESSEQTQLVVVNGFTFYTVNYIGGIELWKSDGTTEGTSLVKKIYGAASAIIQELTAAPDRVYFVVDNDLWTSNGTEQGTLILKHFESHPPATLKVVGSTLFFDGYTSANGTELWKSNGTADGTVLLKDIVPGTKGGINSNFEHFESRSRIAFNSLLYFIAGDSDDQFSSKIWRSDGTAEGTFAFEIADPYAPDSHALELFSGQNFFFIGTGSEHNFIRTNGTNEGTTILKTADLGYTNAICPVGDDLFLFGSDKALRLIPANGDQGILVKQFELLLPRPCFVAFNNKLILGAKDSEHGEELWISDGTPEGTAIIKDMLPGPNGGFKLDLDASERFFASNGYLYYTSYDGDEYLLSRTDGTEEGTQVIADIGYDVHFRQMIANGGHIHFIANNHKEGYALWSTDGTDVGTALVHDLVYKAPDARIELGLAFQGNYYFSANDGDHGQELWRTDGTVEGTQLVKDIVPGYDGSSPTKFIEANNQLFFVAYDPDNGQQLWKTDGTTEGTVRLTDINFGSDFVQSDQWIRRMYTLNDRIIIFSSNSQKTQLWSSDGSIAGTEAITDISSDWIPETLAVGSNGYALFAFEDAMSGLELWRTDGTLAGTSMVKDIEPGTGSSAPVSFVEFNGDFFFQASQSSTGFETWRTDGTESGTVILKDFCPGDCSSSIVAGLIFATSEKLYISARDGVNGFDMYESDGTTAGTTKVNQFNNSALQWTDNQFSLLALDNKVIYGNENSVNGHVRELWQIDESLQHTKFFSSPATSPRFAFTHNNRYLFLNRTVEAGDEIWTTDGTAEGTRMLRDINPGPASFEFNQYEVKRAGNGLYFMGGDLWRTDGDCSTRKMVSDLEIHGYDFFNGKVLLVGSNDEHANELFFYDMSDEPSFTCPVAQTITFEEPGTKKFSERTCELSAGSTSELTVTFTSSDSTTGSISGNVVTFLKTGEVSITAHQSGDDDFTAAVPVTKLLTIIKGDQEIDFDALSPVVVSDSAIVLSATATSELPIVFSSSNPDIASIQGNVVTLLKAGEVQITAHQNGNSNFNTAPAITHTLTIGKGNQTILFGEIPTATYGDEDFELTAAATSELNVEFSSSDSSIVSVHGNVATIHKAGEVTITASQPGNDDYNSADPVEQTLVILKQAQVITFNSIAKKVFGDQPFSVDVSVNSGRPISFLLSDSSIISIKDNIITILKAGTVEITATVDGDDSHFAAEPTMRQLVIEQATQTIFFDPLTQKTFGDVPFTPIATATSSLPVSFWSGDESVAIVEDNKIVIRQAGEVTITAVQLGNENYLSAYGVQHVLKIVKKQQMLTFDSLPVKKVNDNPFDLFATSNSGLPIQFTSSDPTIASIAGSTVTLLKSGKVEITVSQPGDLNHEEAISISRALVVEKVSQEITFVLSGDKAFGDAPFILEATSSSGLPVTFQSSDETIVSIDGSTATIHKAGEVSIGAFQRGDAIFNSSDTVSLTLTISPLITGAERSIPDIEIFPNPVNNVLTIVTEVIIEEVTILDARGGVVLSFVRPGGQIDVEGIGTGLYFLKIIVAGKTSVLKFVKE